MAYLLGVDVGTTGAKALLVDERGNPAAGAITEYPLYAPKPLWSEQQPEDWWRAVCTSIRTALAQARLSGSEGAGVGLTGQMHGLVLLDDSGRVLRPAILWNDQRTAAQCAEIVATAGGARRLLDLTANGVLPGFTAPKLLWVRDNEAETYARIAHLLLPKDYVRYRLTGELASDVADASGTALFDVEHRRWSAEMLDLLAVPAVWLPRTGESSELSGWVGAAGAEASGLKQGTPVVFGAGDQASQAVGSGILAEGCVGVTTGTSGVVFAATARCAPEREGRLHAFCHAVPGHWHLMGVMLSAGGALRWLRDNFGEVERATAALTGEDAYEVLAREAAQVAAGSEGLVFLPYLSGERTPHVDPQARAAFVGLTIRHGKPHAVRAVLEGVAFGLRDALGLVKSAGVPVREVRASGGGAKSPLWRQIQSDVFGSELVTTNATEGAAFGAALLAGVGAGIFGSVQEAVAAAVRITGRTEPNAENGRRYEELYAVYRALYPALRPSFEVLAGRSD